MRAAVLSIVLPCYNEAEAIEPFLHSLFRSLVPLRAAAALEDIEIIIVDDGSEDGSASILENYGSRITLLRHEERRGYGAAIKTGLGHARGEFIGISDIDATYEPMDFATLLRQLRDEALELAIGDRLHDIRNMPLSRRIGNFLFQAAIRCSYGRKVSDSCSGQRLFRAEFSPLFVRWLPDQLDFALAMTLLALRRRLAFAESPVRYYRRRGRSKLNLVSDGFRFLGTILRFRFARFSSFALPVRPVLHGAGGE